MQLASVKVVLGLKPKKKHNVLASDFWSALQRDDDRRKNLKRADPIEVVKVQPLEELFDRVGLVGEIPHFYLGFIPQLKRHTPPFGHGHVDLPEGLLGPAPAYVAEEIWETVAVVDLVSEDIDELVVCQLFGCSSYVIGVFCFTFNHHFI